MIPPTTNGMTAGRALDEWEFLRGEVLWENFGARIRVDQRTWEQWYVRAANKGDRRAVGRLRVGEARVSAVPPATLRWPGR